MYLEILHNPKFIFGKSHVHKSTLITKIFYKKYKLKGCFYDSDWI